MKSLYWALMLQAYINQTERCIKESLYQFENHVKNTEYWISIADRERQFPRHPMGFEYFADKAKDQLEKSEKVQIRLRTYSKEMIVFKSALAHVLEGR